MALNKQENAAPITIIAANKTNRFKQRTHQPENPPIHEPTNSGTREPSNSPTHEPTNQEPRLCQNALKYKAKTLYY